MATFHGMFGTKKKQASSTFSSSLQTNEVTSDGDTIVIPAGPQEAQQQTGQLAVDILEFPTHYEIKAPIAGISINDLDIDVKQNTITIAGRRSTNLIPEHATILVEECFWGDFSRKITMPFVVNPETIEAGFSKESILTLKIPKENGVRINGR